MTTLTWNTDDTVWEKARRERLATAALNGLLSGDYRLPLDGMSAHRRMAVEAVKYADALIKELDRKGKKDD